MKGSNGRLFIVTRNDLKPGIQISSAVHAVTQYHDEWPDEHQQWYQDSNYVAILSAKDYKNLREIIRKANQRCIKYTVFREPDLSNEIVSVAIEPGIKSRKLLSNLPLALKKYKEENE